MSRKPSLTLAFVALAVSVVWMTARPSGQSAGLPSTRNGEWPAYAADIRGTRYSPLDQINGSNFNQLEVAWRFKTDNLGTRPEYKLEGTPLMVKGVLYTTETYEGKRLQKFVYKGLGPVSKQDQGVVWPRATAH